MWCLPVKVAASLQEGTYKYIPYCNFFFCNRVLQVEGYGRFEGIVF
jgi:hypothetical protein